MQEVLLKYGHSSPSNPQLSRHKQQEINYGSKNQFSPTADNIPPVGNAIILQVQGIVGAFLYYGHTVNNKLPVALSAAATEDTKASVHMLLDYVATFPNNSITYRAREMILAAKSDAGYLNKFKARSRAGAHIFLSEDEPVTRLNGTVLTMAQIIKFLCPQRPKPN